MRLLALPVLAVALTGSAPGEPLDAGQTPGDVVARSGETTRAADSARFTVSYSGSVVMSGGVNLGDDTGVLDDHGIVVGRGGSYHPLPKPEAEALGIPEKRWFETDGVKLYLASDMFIPDTEAFFGLLHRADDVRFVGRGSERGSQVRRYSAKLGIDAFLAVNPQTIEDRPTKTGPPVAIQMRDYFEDWFVWERGGQPIQVAIDSKGRIRRVDLALPLERLTVQLYDYGVGVDVSPPPANQVISSTEYESLKTEYCSNPKRQIQPRKPPCQ